MLDSVRKTGQRFLVGFDGLTPSAEVRHLIRDLGVGGVILFARNVDCPEQVAELTRELQAIARDAGHSTPLLIAVDQEGGRVQRLKEPWTRWPPMRILGRTGSEDLARRMGEALASELVACGIRWDMAPVVDVDTNPDNPVIGDRSFGPKPDLVGRLGAAFIRGLQGSGVAACAKHFPGHGDTSVDSHVELPVVNHPRQRLEEIELKPFRTAIEAGVFSIMTAHVMVPELDPDYPTTLSGRIIAEVLRRDLAFDDVVVSDDLEMKAIAAHWGFGEAARLAARAGCDILAVCAQSDAQIEAVDAVIHAVETEEIPWTAMDDACARVRRLKERVLYPFQDPTPREAREAAGLHVVLAEEIVEYSARLV